MVIKIISTIYDQFHLPFSIRMKTCLTRYFNFRQTLTLYIDWIFLRFLSIVLQLSDLSVNEPIYIRFPFYYYLYFMILESSFLRPSFRMTYVCMCDKQYRLTGALFL